MKKQCQTNPSFYTWNTSMPTFTCFNWVAGIPGSAWYYSSSCESGACDYDIPCDAATASSCDRSNGNKYPPCRSTGPAARSKQSTTNLPSTDSPGPENKTQLYLTTNREDRTSSTFLVNLAVLISMKAAATAFKYDLWLSKVTRPEPMGYLYLSVSMPEVGKINENDKPRHFVNHKPA